MVFLQVDRFDDLAQFFSVALDRALAAIDRARDRFDAFLERLADKFDREPVAVVPPRPILPFEMADILPETTHWERLATNLRRPIAGAAAAKSHQDLAAVKLDAAVYELEGLIADLSSVMRVVRNVAGAPVVGRIGPAVVVARNRKAIAA
jgi:hypothetical protein